MQTREVIKEIRWIRSLVSTELENWMFHKGMKEEPDVIRCIVDASQFADRLSRNAAAVQIMQAFGLDQLADRETFYAWVQGNTGSAARHRETSDADKHTKEMAGHSLTIAWRTMMSFVDPFEKLTTPEEMRTPELPKTFISFEIAGIDAENTPLPILSKATGFAEEAYEAVCRVYQTKDGDHLALVKIESGSIIRIDCKGLGEPIKHLKNLILEAWHKLRHKRAEEVLENSKAVLGSLAVIEHIAKRERDGSLSSEEAVYRTRFLGHKFVSCGGPE